MRTGTVFFSERIPFRAAGCSRIVALSSLRPRGGEAPVPCFGGAGFDASRRSGNSGTGAGSVSLRARVWSDRAGTEPLVSRSAGSREARAVGNGARYAAHVRGVGRSEARGTNLRKNERAQRPSGGRGNDQRAGSESIERPRHCASVHYEPLAGPSRRAGAPVRRKSCRMGRMGNSVKASRRGGLFRGFGRTRFTARDSAGGHVGTRQSRAFPDGFG